MTLADELEKAANQADRDWWAQYPDDLGRGVNSCLMERASMALEAAEAQIAALKTALERETRPITWQEVRLAAGEGRLKPGDVLAGCNAELARRIRLTDGIAEPSDA